MTAFNRDLQVIVRGDTKQIARTFTDLPTGITINRAWLTVKATADAADPGLFQIAITTTATTEGQITDASTSDGQLSMRFNINGTQSAAAAPDVRYLYDIQVRDSATNAIYTLVMGSVTFVNQITMAS